MPIIRGCRELASERLAVYERVPPLTSGRFAFRGCGLAVFGGQRALLGGSRAVLRSAFASPDRADEGIGTSELRRGEVLLVGGVPLRRRALARIGVLVARERRDIASVRNRITRGGGLQPRPNALRRRSGRSLVVTGVVRCLQDTGDARLLSPDPPVHRTRGDRLTFG